MAITINGTTGIAGVDGSASTPAYQGADTNTGIAFPAADTVAVATGGSERMRIDSSGNVGIGTSSPTAPLDVNGNVAITGSARRITGDFSNATTANRLMFQNSVSNGTSYVHALPNGTATQAGVLAFNSSDANNASFVQLGATATDVRLTASLVGTGTYLPMTFYTGGSERARITSGGDFLVNTTSAGAGIGYAVKIAVDGGASEASIFKTSAGTGAYCSRMWNSATTGDNKFVNFQTEAGGTDRGSIDYNRAGGQVRYNTTSDYRLKENIVDLPNALQTILQLKPRQFSWKETGNTTTGFIAHELQEVFPDFVSGEKDGIDADGNPRYQGVDTSFLVATLTAAIQELKSELDAAKARIAVLEAK